MGSSETSLLACIMLDQWKPPERCKGDENAKGDEAGLGEELFLS